VTLGEGSQTQRVIDEFVAEAESLEAEATEVEKEAERLEKETEELEASALGRL